MDDQGLQPLQHNDQNALVGTTTSSQVPPAPQSQSQNQAALAASNSHSPFSDITSFLNLDDYVVKISNSFIVKLHTITYIMCIRDKYNSFAR